MVEDYHNITFYVKPFFRSLVKLKFPNFSWYICGISLECQAAAADDDDDDDDDVDLFGEETEEEKKAAEERAAAIKASGKKKECKSYLWNIGIMQHTESNLHVILRIDILS